MASNSKPRVRLGFNPWDYNPQGLTRYTEKELRKEYTRLRAVAQKRLNRLMSSEFHDTQTVAYNAGRYIPLAGVQSEGELRHLLTDLASFLLSEASTVTGQRNILRRHVETWQEKGFHWVNEKNIRGFLDFLEYVKSVEGYVYDVSTVAEAYEELEMEEYQRPNQEQMKGAYDYYVEKTDPRNYNPRAVQRRNAAKSRDSESESRKRRNKT